MQKWMTLSFGGIALFAAWIGYMDLQQRGQEMERCHNPCWIQDIVKVQTTPLFFQHLEEAEKWDLVTLTTNGDGASVGEWIEHEQLGTIAPEHQLKIFEIISRDDSFFLFTQKKSIFLPTHAIRIVREGEVSFIAISRATGQVEFGWNDRSVILDMDPAMVELCNLMGVTE